MAVVTETKVVMIELRSESNDNTRIRVDNPKDNLTRADIISAFQPAFNNRWLLGNKGDVLSSVGEIVLETASKIPITGGEFSYNPTTLQINATVEANSTSNAIVYYSGAVPSNVGIEKTSTSIPAVYTWVELDTTNSQIIFHASNGSLENDFTFSSDYTNTIIVTVQGVTIRIPVILRTN